MNLTKELQYKICKQETIKLLNENKYDSDLDYNKVTDQELVNDFKALLEVACEPELITPMFEELKRLTGLEPQF